MAKQRFNTKAQRNISLWNNIVFFSISFIILAFSIVVFIGFVRKTPVVDPATINSPEFLRMMALTVLVGVEIYLILLLPVCAIYFGLQSGRKKGYREDATFNSSQGITYFRDILKDISPASMSIIMDLRIEDNKDISATLLRLYDKKMINFEDTGIVYTGNTAVLDNGEQELMNMLFSSGITPGTIRQWKMNRRQDAITEGYVLENKVQKEKGCCGIGCLSIILMIIGMIVISVLVFPSEEFLNDVQVVLERAEVLGILQSDLSILSAFIVRAIILFAIVDLVVAFPSYALFRASGYSAVKKGSGGLKRTPKGDEMAEKIAGLQRYIHEFSNLSEAMKEQVVLWNDFLVYAVVLEENESIVSDINRLYKIDLSNVEKQFKVT